MARIVSFLLRTSVNSFRRETTLLKRLSVAECRPNTEDSVRLLHVSSAVHGSAGEGMGVMTSAFLHCFHKTSDFDKKILVWSKMYPKVEDVPEEVTNTKMKKAKDVFRIRANILMAIATMGLCILYIISGKRAVEKGGSISQMNRDRHSDYQSKDT